MCIDKYDDAIKVLKEQDLTNNSYYNYLLGECFYFKCGKIYFKDAVKYYSDALLLCNDDSKERILEALGDSYFELIDIDNLLKTADELRKIKKHGYCDYLEASAYRLSQRFDEAENLLKVIKKAGDTQDYKLKNLEEACLTNPEKLNPYHNLTFSQNDSFSIRNKLKITMFGEYGNNIDMKKAKEHATDLENIEVLSTCCYSTLSNYYLFIKDYEKAYEKAKIGYDKYLKEEEACQCCAPFVAYCKLKGLGTNKSVEEAYNICLDTEKRELIDLNENMGHVYAECCILLNKNLESIYEKLIKTTFRRYSPSRYFMIIKIGKLLKKDISKYEILFRESLKYGSIREKEYYSKNQEDFLLNNY